MKKDKKIGNSLFVCSLFVAPAMFINRNVDDSQVFVLSVTILLILAGLFFRIRAFAKERQYWRSKFLK